MVQKSLFFRQITNFRRFSRIANTSGVWPGNIFLIISLGVARKNADWITERFLSQNKISVQNCFRQITNFRNFTRFANTSGVWPANIIHDYHAGCCKEECWAKSRTISVANQNFVQKILYTKISNTFLSPKQTLHSLYAIHKG